MITSFLLLIAVAALIALAFWWRQRGKRQHPRASREQGRARATGDYRCVELRYPGNACDAVKRFGAKRFLPGEVPAIPVPGCDVAQCVCRYVHHDDRRDDDRRHPFGQQASQPPLSAGGERRIKKDRRRSGKPTYRPKPGR
jgi:hypothetical protein